MPDKDTDAYIFVWAVPLPSVMLPPHPQFRHLWHKPFIWKILYIFPLTATMLCHLSSQWSSLWNPCFCSHHCCQWPHQPQSWVTAGDCGGTPTPISFPVESSAVEPVVRPMSPGYIMCVCVAVYGGV